MIRVNKIAAPVIALAFLFAGSTSFAKSSAKKSNKESANAEKTESAEKNASAKKASSKKTSEKVTAENSAPVKTKVPTKGKYVENASGEPVFRAKTLEKSVGAVKILMKGAVGSFQLYALNENGSAISLLSGNDEFTSSFFSMKIGKNEYRLTDAAGAITGARKTEKGGQMVYVIPGIARVLVGFDVIQSDPKRDPDVIKVTLEVMNRSQRYASIYLKQVLDTVLGEKLGPHFQTAEDLALNSEIQLRRFDKIKYIYSGSSKAAMSILLHGADITKPEVVSVSNKDILALPEWVPEVVRSRTFDSVLSYNNSAVCINWDALELAPNETGKIVYYIMTATDGRKIDSDAFIQKVEKQLKAEKAKEAASKDGSEKINVKETSDEDSLKKEEDELKSENASENPFNRDSADESESSIRTNVPFNIDSIDPEKLDPAYVQALLDKINSLEADSEGIDREEILQLNAELDAIMTKLRQQ